MDRHDVLKDVTAEIVADLHQKDLKIQHRFNCRGLTYWFDDKRKTAFCLIEAPDKAAIKAMHDQAHGEVSNQIIEVDDAVVASFLGRIKDPAKSLKTELNIINDPAFRTIMVVGLKSASLIDLLEDKLNFNIARQYDKIGQSINSCKGRLVKRFPNYFLISFDSVTRAVSCALKIAEDYEECSSKLKLKIGLSAGIPVENEGGFFENSIKAAHSYFEHSKGTIILSPEVKDLYESENFNSPIRSPFITTLKREEEKFLKVLVEFIEKEWKNTSLNIEDFNRYFGYSKSRFYRKLIAVTGKSPNTILKEFRLNRALDLLIEKDMNISEVAYECGFNSPAYFSKCFQEIFGILPSEFLRSVRP